MEIERKFLIDRFPDLPLLKQAVVYQGYIATDPVVRIRRYEPTDGPASHILCFKGPGTLARAEIEIPIATDIYEQLCALLPMPPVRKDFRVYALPDGHSLECSLVDAGEPTSFFYAEIEFASLEEAKAYTPPPFLQNEVTEQKGYGMASYWRRKQKRRGTSGSENGTKGSHSRDICV